MFRRLIAGLAAAAALVLATADASAQTTLEKILRDKKVRITAEVTSPPFGITKADGTFDGSEIATARQLAKDLGVELELVQVTATERIPALLAGRADIAVSSLSITLERAKTVAFANPHGALSIVITGPQKVAIKSAADLAGKRIAITRATLEEATVPRQAPQGTNIVYFNDIASTIQALISGQVDAAGMSAFAAKSVRDRAPQAQLEDKFTVTTAFYAAATRPADHDLRQWINTWVFINTRNGVLGQIYEQPTGVKLIDLPVF
jgi:polar amino acid transport system substrate-binding protein